jgi:hypothetical protein
MVATASMTVGVERRETADRREQSKKSEREAGEEILATGILRLFTGILSILRLFTGILRLS